MSGLVTELIAAATDLTALEPDWQRLWRAQARPEVFTSFAWSRAAFDAFGEGRRLCIVVVRRDGRVVGLLPLIGDRRRLGFLAGPHSDYNDILVDDADPAAVVEAALRALLAAGVMQRCDFAEVPEWATLRSVLPRLAADLQRRIVVTPGLPCPALRLGADRAALLESMIGKKSLKRHEKKLAQLGSLKLRHLETRDEIRAALPDFYAQHVARRAVVGDRSLFLRREPRKFFEGLVEHFDPDSALRFAVLEAGGRPVAYHLGFACRGRFTWYKPSFDVDHWDRGPGEVLIKRLLEHVRDAALDEFDFTRGGESFKDRFANHQGRNAGLGLHRSAAGAALARLLARAKDRLKANPRSAALIQAWRERRRKGVEPPARVAAGEAPPDVELRGASLRTLAELAAAGSPLLSLAELPAARERLAAGQVAELGLRDGRVVWLGWRAPTPAVSP